MTVDSTRTRRDASAADAPRDDAADDDEGRDDAPQGGASGGQPTDDDSADDTDYQSLYARERRERRRLEREVRRTRDQARPSQDAEQRASQAERERDDLRTELHRERAFTRLMRLASDEGAIDPEAVATMLLATGDVEVDDQGRPVDGVDAVKDLLRRKAYLKGTRQPSGGERQRPTGDAGRGRQQGAGGTDEEAQAADFNSAFRRAAAKSRSGG